MIFSREAKREASWRAGGLIRDALEQGWPSETFEPDDMDRVVAALWQIVEMLERRGAKEDEGGAGGIGHTTDCQLDVPECRGCALRAEAGK